MTHLRPLYLTPLLFFILPCSLSAQILPWRYEIEKRIERNERLVEILLQAQKAPQQPQSQPQIIIADPRQIFPIEGQPKQILPIEGQPKQPFPIEGSPKQPLPIEGSPKQDLNPGGKPKQDLLIPPVNTYPQTYTHAIWRPYYVR